MAHATSAATGMSFTLTAPPASLMPDAHTPVSLGVPPWGGSAVSFAHTTVGWTSQVVEKLAKAAIGAGHDPLAPDE